MNVKIYSLSESNVDDALAVCTPEKLRDIPSYREGLKVRREWLLGLYRTVGPCCKIAYLEDVPVGMIQYTALHHVPYFPTERRDVLYIHCIYVKRDFRGRGIGSKLLDVLMKEMRMTNPLFKEHPCKIFVTTARQHTGFKQPSYFLLKGFTRTMDNIDVGLTYWLSEKRPGERLDIPVSGPIQVREEGVQIFYSPACQYCMFWNERIRKFVDKVKPNARVNEVNLWTQPEEAIRRKVTSPITYVNGKPIPPMDPDQFYKNIKTIFRGKEEHA
jgi:GNAT superfamily N-acetyltransferase